MAAAPSATPPGRGGRLALVALALLAAASLPLLVHPWFDETNDGAMYVLTARALAAGEGYVYNDVPFRIRPPGLPLLLAPVLALRGTDFHALNLLVASFGAAAAVLLALHARPRVGWAAAVLLGAALFTSGPFRELSSQVMSDVPGLALLLACLAVERWADRAPSARREAALGLAIGLAGYVRPAVLLLAPAVALGRLLRGDLGVPDTPRTRRVATRLGLPVLVAALAFAPWPARNALNPPELPLDQVRNWSYGTATWHVDRGDPTSPRLPLADVAGRVPEHGLRILGLLGARLTRESDAPRHLVAGGALVLALVAVAARRRRSAELVALALLGATSISYHFVPRHLLPPLWLAVVAAADLLGAAAARVHPRLRATAPAAAAAALLALDLDLRPRWDAIRRRHEELVRTAAAIASQAPPDARLAAPYGWLYAVHLGRPVHNLGFAAERAGDLRAAEAVLDRYALDAVVLTDALPADRAWLPYFRARHGHRGTGPVHVVRVRR